MKDAEFIYSLYVQANPVPDPDLLPLTRDEAALLSFERSPDMITEEQTDKNLAQSPKHRRIAVALGAAVVLIAVIATTAIVFNGDSGPVAAADASPVVVFDGTTCSYEGPTLIEEGVVEFSITNSADERVNLVQFRMEEPARSRALEEVPVGADTPLGGDPMPSDEYAMATVFPGLTMANDFTMRPGTYLVDCVTVNTDHAWRVAKVEVVAP